MNSKKKKRGKLVTPEERFKPRHRSAWCEQEPSDINPKTQPLAVRSFQPRLPEQVSHPFSLDPIPNKPHFKSNPPFTHSACLPYYSSLSLSLSYTHSHSLTLDLHFLLSWPLKKPLILHHRFNLSLFHLQLYRFILRY